MASDGDDARQIKDWKRSGILRVDVGRPKSTTSTVEFHSPPEQISKQPKLDANILSSPQPSVDRLSVTWAEPADSPSSEASAKVDFLFTPGSPPITSAMEVRFPDTAAVEDAVSEEEDYSASVSAIMQRRASTRRSRRGTRAARRPSSPFVPEAATTFSAGTSRRRSSAYTTSSGDTAISVEETIQEVTQEQIFENIRLHKEVLSSVKQQPWGMRRKLRLVYQAKTYIKRHEGALQERLALSKSTRDILARFNILVNKRWQRLKREANNFSNWLIPWELRIKEIESHFGSVVASYFTFLRWLFWVNLVISVTLLLFVIVPEQILAAGHEDTGERKEILPEERNKSTNLLILWEFEGVLKYSPIFYGYYTNRDPGDHTSYRLPMAYFMTGLAVYVYSFVATLRKMAENSRMSKLSEKDDECTFSWKLFTGWDFMIGNAETAHNRTASIILGFKEALLEEAEKKKDPRNWKVLTLRIIVNACVVFLLGVSAYAVIVVVQRSTKMDQVGWWAQNEITIVMSLISFIFPIFFELLGFFERYHPRKQLRIQLARIMLLNLLNLYSLIFALFDKISDMTRKLEELKPTTTSTTVVPYTAYEITPPTIKSQMETSKIITTFCYKVATDCATAETTDDYKAISPANLMRNITRAVTTALVLAGTTEQPNNYYYENVTGLLDNFSMLNFSADMRYDNVSMDFLSLSTSMTPTLEEEFYEGDYDSDGEDYNSLAFPEVVDEMGKGSDITSTESFDNATEMSYYNHSTIFDDLINDTVINDFNDTAINVTIPFNYTELSETESATDFSSIESTASSTPYIDEDSSSTESETESGCYILICEQNVTENATAKTFPSQLDKPLLDKSTKAPIRYTDDMYNSHQLDMDKRKQLRRLCWETMFGQELVKLTMMDLVLTILGTLFVDFFRALFVRFMNKCWCWDLEKRFPQYGDFKIAENILHLVNNQGMVWMGMFFSPGLALLNLIKLVIMMYLRSWAVMTCNVPHEVVFRASRSNNFYLALLLTMLFLCVLPVGYAIVRIEPSWHCGPFSHYKRIYYLFTENLQKALPPTLQQVVDYIASPGIVIPLLVLLILIIYYLLSLTSSLREANNDLKIQLRRERTEERRKMFQIADRRHRGGSSEMESTAFSKWKKILPILPANKSIESDDKKNNDEFGADDLKSEKKGDIFAKIVKMALRKSSEVDIKEPKTVPAVDDETDTEFHESLPEDVLNVKDIRIHPRPHTKTARFARKESIDPAEMILFPHRHEEYSTAKHNKKQPAKISLENEINKQDDPEAEPKVARRRPKTLRDVVRARNAERKVFKIEEVVKEILYNEEHGNKQQPHTLSKSISDSSQSKHEDSLTSIIPVIMISKTESDDEILEATENKNAAKDEQKEDPQKEESVTEAPQMSKDSENTQRLKRRLLLRSLVKEAKKRQPSECEENEDLLDPAPSTSDAAQKPTRTPQMHKEHHVEES